MTARASDDRVVIVSRRQCGAETGEVARGGDGKAATGGGGDGHGDGKQGGRRGGDGWAEMARQ